MRKTIASVAFLLVFSTAGAAYAQETPETEDAVETTTVEAAPADTAPAPDPAPLTDAQKALKVISKYLKFNGVLQTVMVYRNDYDFDSTPRYYDADGQSVGILGTFFKPQLSLFPVENLKIFWEMELGLNMWSRHNADQYQSGNFDTFRLAHRELYVEGKFLDGWLGFKVGYQFFEDPGRMFLGHWIGAANIWTDARFAKFTVMAGQLPGQTYEGIGLNANNFRHDTFVYGARADVPVKEWNIAISILGLHDAETIGQTLDLMNASMRVSANYGWVNFGLDAAFQYGKTKNGASTGDETTLAWALQAFAQFKAGGFDIQLNQLVLSADDVADRNAHNGAFFYSGKSRSRTLILSEDEIRDQGYNLDEFMSQKRNNFYLSRAGLSLTDLTVSYNLKDIFVPAIIVGAGFTLEPDNALGGRMIGVETDLDLELRYRDILSFHLVGGILFPGKAAAVYVNSGDLSATNNQYMVQASLSVMY